MKFVWGKVVEPEKEIVIKQKGWQELKLPTGFMFIALLTGFFTLAIIHLLLEYTGITFSYSFRDIWIVLPVITFHELIHAFFLPGKITAKNKKIGLSLKEMSFYVYSGQEIKKNRFLMVVLMPAVLLTVFPLFFLLFTSLESNFLIYFLKTNWLLSSFDLLAFFYIFFHLPSDVYLQEAGPNTYWKSSQ